MQDLSFVVEGKHIGRRFTVFPLSKLVETTPGADQISEVYLKTEQGFYLIYKPNNCKHWVISGARNKKMIPLKKEDIKKGVIKVETSFKCHVGACTPTVLEIIGIDMTVNKIYIASLLDNSGHKDPDCRIRNDFAKEYLRMRD